MEFRKSYPTDAYLLVNLRNTVWKNTYYDILPNGILHKMEDEKEDNINHLKGQILENNRIIVALDNDKIVGYIFYAKSKTNHYEASGEIREILVLPNYQGKGIGTKLFNLAKEELKKLGFNSVVILCPRKGTNKEFFMNLGGIIKENVVENTLGFPIQTDILYIDFDNVVGTIESDWNMLYEEAQKHLYLLNDINKEIAAILSINGNIYLGLGIGHKVCPIESALSNLYLNEETKISKIVILNKNSKLVLPCGRCRDLLINLGQDKAEILFDIGNLQTMTMKELNPYYKDEEKV